MANMLQELNLAFRILRKHWTFTLTCILLLALGIGASTAMFSIVDSALIHALPYPDSSRMVELRTHWLRGTGATGPLSYPDFLDLKQQNQVFDIVAVYRTDDFTVSAPGGSFHVRGGVVSANLFSLLGSSPYLGRAFSPQEDTLEGTSSSFPVVMSYSLWRERFNADPGILGTTLVLSGTRFTVTGVMGKEFAFPLPPEQVGLWVTVAIDLLPSGLGAQRNSHYLNGIGLLKSGVTIQTAQEDINVIMARLAQEYAESNHDKTVTLKDERDAVVGSRRSQLIILCFAVGCVLLICCINVATLMLARSANQEREMAVRLALGGGRRRVLRQMLTQSLLLAFFGAVLGILIALWGISIFLGSMQATSTLPQLGANPEVLLFAVAVSVSSAFLCAVVPALQSFKKSQIFSLLSGSRTTTGSRRHTFIRNGLIIGEMILAVVVLVEAGLMVRSLDALSHVDTGFNTGDVLTFQLQFPSAQYSDAARNQTLDSVLERIRQLPGVRHVSAVTPLPLSGSNIAAGFQIPGNPLPSSHVPIADFALVAPDYFQTMGIQIVRGRPIVAQDAAPDAHPVALINESLAAHYFPSQNPIGHSIRALLSGGNEPPPPQEIVGVVRNVRSRDLRNEARDQVYLPHTKLDFDLITVIVQANKSLLGDINAIRSEIGRVAPALAPYDFRPLQDYVSISMAKLRFSMWVLVLFAVIALCLTTIGLYSVISYTVAQGNRELGIRLALGAQKGNILQIVLRRGLMLAFLGVTTGLLIAITLTRLASSLLFRVEFYDPLTFLTVGALVTAMALIASYVPARSAAGIDPASTLRLE